jgi:zinc transporter 2
MLATAFVSLACNMFNLAALGHIPLPCFGEPIPEPGHAAPSDGESAENLNVRAAVVHVLGDMLQSAAVITAATLINFCPNAKIADPLCTFLFSVMVIMTTAPVTRECFRILMEVQPHVIDTEELRDDVLAIDGVYSVEDIHVWALSQGKNYMTVHIKKEDDDEIHTTKDIYNKVTEVVGEYDITHFTV